MHPNLLIRNCGVESDTSIEFIENLIVNVWPRSRHLDDRVFRISMTSSMVDMCICFLRLSPDPTILRIAAYIGAKRGPHGASIKIEGAYIDPFMSALQHGLKAHLVQARLLAST